MSELAIYVNGINNTPNQAEEVRQTLQKKIKVDTILVYNSHVFENGILKLNQEQFNACVEDLNNVLAKHLDSKTHIFLVLHSMGTYVGLQALQTYPDQTQTHNYVTVWAYGGITVLPKYLAQRVANCINLRDKYAKLGARILDNKAWWTRTTEEGQVWWEAVLDDKDQLVSKAKAKYNVNPIKPLPAVKTTWKTFINDWYGEDGEQARQHSFSGAYLKQCSKDVKEYRYELAKKNEPIRVKRLRELVCKRLTGDILYYELGTLGNSLDLLRKTSDSIDFIKKQIGKDPVLSRKEKSEIVNGIDSYSNDIVEIDKLIKKSHYLRFKRIILYACGSGLGLASAYWTKRNLSTDV